MAGGCPPWAEVDGLRGLWSSAGPGVLLLGETAVAGDGTELPIIVGGVAPVSGYGLGATERQNP